MLKSANQLTAIKEPASAEERQFGTAIIRSHRMSPRLLLLLLLLFALPAPAAQFAAYKADVAPQEVFPDADRFGPAEGTPAAQAAYKGDKVAGYVFEAGDIGYSGKPIKLLAGIDLNGVITGAKVTEHHEPILLVGIPVQKLFDFVNGYVGRSVIEMTATGAKRPVVDVISGATVTAMVVDDALLRTALKVARTRGLAGFDKVDSSKTTLVDLPFAAKDWTALLGDGSVRRLDLDPETVDAAFKKIGVTEPEAFATPVEPGTPFIDLYASLVTPEIIGRNLLGNAIYDSLKNWLEPGQSAIIIAANGSYSFRGSGYVRGGIFDRIQLVQEGVSFRFTDKLYRRLGNLEGGAPDFAEIGLFKLPKDADFDPAKPWRLELLAQRATGAREKAFVSFSLDYAPPAALVRAAAPAIAKSAPARPQADAEDEENDGPKLWEGVWQGHFTSIIILTLSLIILTLIFFFQDWLVKKPKLFYRLRLCFLAFTVIWIGGVQGAQLSVVNVFTFSHALMSGFRWDFFLLEPLVFLLWCATAVSLLFWGRGAYCGWLCPMGALQELLSEGAKRVGIRQFSPRFSWHERFWAIKYVVFLGLFGLSLKSVALAERFAEIEPFKTVWLLHFAREWPFVLFAVAVLAAGLFIERAYCRYLCPLGAALAIPGRGRLFEWLKRRKQCGYECTKCAKECMVQAIHPDGHINPNECLYCMHCQVTYFDHDSCTPLVMKRLARGKKDGPQPQILPQKKENSDV